MPNRFLILLALASTTSLGCSDAGADSIPLQHAGGAGNGAGASSVAMGGVTSATGGATAASNGGAATMQGGTGGLATGGTATAQGGTASGGGNATTGGSNAATGGSATGGKSNASGGSATGGSNATTGGKSPASGGSNAASGGSATGGKSSAAGGSASGGSATGGSATGGLPEVLTRAQYEAMFPNRNALYDYDSLVAAASKYPAFANTGALADRRREVAALLANFAHETTGGWPTAPGGPEAWGLYFTQEVGCENGACTQYCDASNTEYPCAKGKTYHGRGPIQLSWNYNYGAMGKVLGVDLLANPELVTSNGRVAFETGLWFWMTPQSPKPSAHDALLGSWQPNAQDTAAGRKPGFGMTINIINGGLECGFATDDRVKDRIRFFQHFTTLLSTTPGENLECATMQPY